VQECVDEISKRIKIWHLLLNFLQTWSLDILTVKPVQKLSSGITCDVHTVMTFAVVWNGRPQLCFHPQRETSNIANWSWKLPFHNNIRCLLINHVTACIKLKIYSLPTLLLYFENNLHKLIDKVTNWCWRKYLSMGNQNEIDSTSVIKIETLNSMNLKENKFVKLCMWSFKLFNNCTGYFIYFFPNSSLISHIMHVVDRFWVSNKLW
jgi:hypothetical protein